MSLVNCLRINSKPVTVSLGLLCAAVLIALCYWQATKAYYFLKVSQLVRSPSISEQPIDYIKKPISDGNLVKIADSIDLKRFFLVTHATRAHPKALEVIGIHQLPHQKRPILVNLGIVSAPEDAPNRIKSANTSLNITGLLVSPSGKLLSNHPIQQPLTWPKHLAFLDLHYISASLGMAVHPQVIYTTHSKLGKQWYDSNFLAQKIARHSAYALQFLVFGIMAIIYSFVLSRKQASGKPHA